MALELLKRPKAGTQKHEEAVLGSGRRSFFWAPNTDLAQKDCNGFFLETVK